MKNPAAVELGKSGGLKKSEKKTEACRRNASKPRGKRKSGDSEIRTFEGTFLLKWFKNDSYGDRRGITIDCKDRIELKKRLSKIKSDFLTLGENGKLPYSITFDMTERI